MYAQIVIQIKLLQIWVCIISFFSYFSYFVLKRKAWLNFTLYRPLLKYSRPVRHDLKVDWSFLPNLNKKEWTSTFCQNSMKHSINFYSLLFQVYIRLLTLPGSGRMKENIFFSKMWHALKSIAEKLITYVYVRDSLKKKHWYIHLAALQSS